MAKCRRDIAKQRRQNRWLQARRTRCSCSKPAERPEAFTSRLPEVDELPRCDDGRLDGASCEDAMDEDDDGLAITLVEILQALELCRTHAWWRCHSGRWRRSDYLRCRNRSPAITAQRTNMTASAAVSCSVPSITRTTTPAVRSASPPVRRLWSPLNVIPVELRRAHSASDPSEHQQLPLVPPWSERHA